MFRVNRSIERPAAKLVEELKQFPTGIISDVALELVVMEKAIKPLQPGSRMVGPAITVDNPAGDNLACHMALELIEPGDVLVVAGGSTSRIAFLGDLMCTMVVERGGAGVVVDGAVRDVADLRELELSVFAKEVSPIGPGKSKAGSINVPIVCGGIQVKPGDVIVADDDGVCVVARETLDEVIEAARQKLARESEIRSRIKAGETTMDILGLQQAAEEAGMRPDFSNELQ